MIALLVLHAILGSVLFPTSTRLGRRALLFAALAPIATLTWLIAHTATVLDGGVVTEDFAWVPDLGLRLQLRLDGFALLMVAMVAVIGIAVCVYAFAYFPADGGGLGRIAGLLTMFAGAMLCVVLADNLLVLYAGWELTSVTSYLLIGNDHRKIHARAAALHALLVTSLGGLAMLAGFVLIGSAAGTYRMSTIFERPPTGTTVSVGLVLVLVGAFTKSAQYPFHSWLPGAMTAPAPVSAYLHSATMVKAGVYLVGRFALPFATMSIWRPLVVVVGLTTMIAGALRALRQIDLKLLLAYSTVSQLGFLVVLFGIGEPAITTAGCVMIVAHAVFKATLFMAVGGIDHLTGTREIGKVPALGRGWLPLSIAATVAALSMAGLPLAFGFIGKEAGFEALLHSGVVGSGWILAGLVVGSGLTAGYTARLLWGMFGPSVADWRAARQPAADRRSSADVPPTVAGHAPPAAMIGPIAVLSIVTLALGVVPRFADDLIGVASRSLGATEPVHLALWHGWNPALGLSAIAIASGLVLFLARSAVQPVLAVGARLPSGLECYAALLRWTNTASTRVTAVVQNGSLPAYAGVTLLTAALVPGIVLVTATTWPGWPQAVGSWAQLPVVVLVLGAAIAAAAVRRRFSAALFLGTAGYGMAGLFVVQGAPDLALTQVAIETLSTVLFVLVLRRLPDRFERTSTNRRRAVRVVISLSVGVTVFLFAIIGRANRDDTEVSDAMIEQSLPEAHGRNVVNVILVDMRGFDTMGEITVLTSAAIGAVALARVGRRRRTPLATAAAASGARAPEGAAT